MILTYAGRLPGSADFPAENVEYVREQIERLLTNLMPRAVVGGAAAGADLLVLEAALRAGVAATIVSAGTSQELRASSVAGRGDQWERLFDAVLAHEDVDLIEVPRHPEDDASYAAVTKVILSLARSMADDDEPIAGLNVSVPREGQDHSDALSVANELAGRLVLRLDPTRTRERTQDAFVAMPFGRREDRASGWTAYEADATYRRIILPALIDAGYRPVRADAEALLEVIDITMLRAINGAPVLVGDLATLNPNVMWEVGVRHAWRRSGTILLRPHGSSSPPPFDVSHARVHEYRRGETSVEDADAIAGIRLMRDLLAAVDERRVDSPVFATMQDLAETRLRPAVPDVATAAAHRHIEAVSLAADLKDPVRLLEREQAVQGDGRLTAQARSSLLEQIGLALIGVGRHADAARILEPLAVDDVALEHVRLQQRYAHALIRSASADGRDGRLQEAERRLRVLAQRGRPSGETLGLLGSAAKARIEEALAAGEPVDGHVRVAIDAYLTGFRHDPADYYPGIVALALLRLRGQHLAPDPRDVEQARELLPVVRFAATRLGMPDGRDLWRLATVAELHLHDYLLTTGSDDELVEATKGYARVAASGSPQQRDSAARQLRLMRDAGDPREVLDALLDLFV